MINEHSPSKDSLDLINDVTIKAKKEKIKKKKKRKTTIIAFVAPTNVVNGGFSTAHSKPQKKVL